MSKDRNVIIKDIKLENQNDDKVLKKELINQIYAFPEKKVIIVADIGFKENFLIYIDKIEKLLEENKAYYDKVEVNEKTKDTDLEIQFDNILNKEGHVIRFRNQKEKKIKLKE